MLGSLGLAWGLPVAAGQHDEALATLADFVDILIPADGYSPSASALKVHLRIWQQAEQRPLLERFIRKGCLWLDRQSRGQFTSLPPHQKQALMQWMSRQPESSYPFQLFNRLRHDAMGFYYSHPDSWKGLAISQPPQPHGYKEI
ncbi:gluconate 2-dehydrogenase subunit 3 family protein [Marinobacterium sediminicola]|uniref:Gluconate 2-dehydrogenase subunit 3 n=1 Tax=Marinobacterium sediminicola TaxID=518898 RepID=A0ABY1S0N2_9GAMM|nr:gluconate 2-dehydrogenase subunit 3 family protein [Marinobacterium sediminicola]ULG68367.1 gluconate 2-dehydrogenase subunit 3 family protein [Marinobacterium sediminicola]SMR74754.1 Gluconate 2-dehydrogenase subunit 3 [Marinobacterium sediminicola]